MPRIPGLLERIQQPLYDDASHSPTVAQFGTSVATYFQVPLGAGTSANGAGAKNLVDTNMDQGGSLPYPKNFEVHDIHLIYSFGSNPIDIARIIDNAWFHFFIGTKDYLTVSAYYLTAGIGLHGVVTGNSQVRSVQHGRSDQSSVVYFAETIDLIPQQNFYCQLVFPVPFGSGGTSPLTSAVNIWCYLTGFLKREVH